MFTGIEAGIAYGVTKGAIAALVKPVATATLVGLRSLSSTVVDIFSDRLAEYVTQQAERHSCMSTIVFGHQRSLGDLYIPLTLVPMHLSRQESEKGELLIDRFNNEFLPKNDRVLITDTAGMGKSTLSKFLFLQCLKSCYAVPFYIELRHLSNQTDIVSIIFRQLNPSTSSEDEPKFTKKQIERLLRMGNLLFFFDGYDEIPIAHREVATIGIKDLVDRFPKNTYVITSRPESGLLAFPAFKQFGIRPLKLGESIQLIRRYDEGGGRAEQLIKKLESAEYRSVREFLKNPLLTSLLYRSFEYKQSVPLKKHVFYRQVFDALFDWHDATKDGYNTREKRSGLDIDTFHRMLRVVGFVSVMKGQVEGDTDAVLGWIRQAKEVCKITALPESHFLDDLVRAVPVFVKDGDFYRWSHKSLSEYFAAQYICTEGKSQQGKVLSTFISSRQISRFMNVLDQLYDIDNAGFREHLILPTAQAFSKYWAHSYKGLDPAVKEEDIRLRKACVFDRTIVFIKTFDFKNQENFKRNVSLYVKPVTGFDIQFETVNIIMIDERKGANPSIIASVVGPYSSILSILSSKRDALVVNHSKVDWESGKTNPRFKFSASAEVLVDNPDAEYNQPEVFSRVTKLIARPGPIVDIDKMLSFERNFNDLSFLSSFADDLLKPMSIESK